MNFRQTQTIAGHLHTISVPWDSDTFLLDSEVELVSISEPYYIGATHRRRLLVKLPKKAGEYLVTVFSTKKVDSEIFIMIEVKVKP